MAGGSGCKAWPNPSWPSLASHHSMKDFWDPDPARNQEDFLEEEGF